MKKYDRIIQNLTTEMPVVFEQQEFRQRLDDIKMGATLRRKVYHTPKKILLKWNKTAERTLYSFHKEYEFLDVLEPFCRTHVISHYSALYFNELIEQRPEHYYLTKEIKGRKAIHTDSLNSKTLKQVFMKSPRTTAHFAKFRRKTISFLEKIDLGLWGVGSKRFRFGDREVVLEITNIERTLIDSLVAPQYAGGINTVIFALDRALINLRDLYKYYELNNFLYPYWQSLGLLLEKVKGMEIAKEWESLFNKRKIDFYFTRGYRSDWEFSEKWKVHYPKGIL